MALILVSGSRSWTDTTLIAVHLAAARDALQEPPGKRMALMHGACPKRRVGDSWASADALAADVADRWGWIVLPRPANWTAGRGAGYARNQAMVDECAAHQRRGVHVACLVFTMPCVKPHCRIAADHWSHGAVHCGTAAAEAGLPVTWVRPDGTTTRDPGVTRG